MAVEVDAFETWCDKTMPVRLFTKDLPLDRASRRSRRPKGLSAHAWQADGSSVRKPAHILTHDKGWISATVQQIRRDARWLDVEPSGVIEGGTSGGPVISEDGRLLGVIAYSGHVFDPNTPEVHQI